MMSNFVIPWALLYLVLMAGIANTSCGGRDETNSSETPTKTVVVPDSAANWHEFVAVTDYHISIEKDGERPPGGLASWAELWDRSIRGLREHYENHEKYVNYIIQARARAGLPSLPKASDNPQD